MVKSYIGQTIFNLDKRIKGHYNDKLNTYFHRALIKYGKENFEWSILKECNDFELLNILETYMIMVHNTYVKENGYNLNWGGGSNNGYKHTEEALQKMSELKKGNSNNLGKHFTEEHKQKMSEAHRGEKCYIFGKHITEDHKQKISENLKGNKNALGKTHTEETKQKMSEAHRGQIPWNKGKKHTKETKRKMSKAHKKIYL